MIKRHLREGQTKKTNLRKCEGLQKGLISETQIKCIRSDMSVCMAKRDLRKRQAKETYLRKCEGLQKARIYETHIKCIRSDICSECIHDTKRSTKETGKRDLLTQV